LSQSFSIHPQTPQPRLVRQAAALLAEGGVLVLPTDSTYALACRLGEKQALERICRIRQIDERHRFTLCVRDLSQLGTYAKVSTPQYRILRSLTPGPYTWILPATDEVPRRLQHRKRRQVGLRVPDHRIAQAVLEEVAEPIFSTSLILPGDAEALADPVEIRRRLQTQVDGVIDGGWGGTLPTTMVDLTGDEPVVLRAGLGDPSPFTG